mmetsp:Transcript_18781/g.71073  ORF Transcript_18781/g.71073 Transcript_18781/m.71073 type:complete len:526 (-) Transcript_18781:353-1930(-)
MSGATTDDLPVAPVDRMELERDFPARSASTPASMLSTRTAGNAHPDAENSAAILSISANSSELDVSVARAVHAPGDHAREMSVAFKDEEDMDEEEMGVFITLKAPEEGPHQAPRQRSLHVTVVYGDKLYVFGGYDGYGRVNGLYEYHLQEHVWRKTPSHGIAPSPRDRHVGVVYNGSMYIFGGYDGTNRINDFHQFHFETNTWDSVAMDVLSAAPPSPRHSHAAAVYKNSLYVFGGYDGSYRSDFHEFNFLTHKWEQVTAAGRVPRARYRATCTVYGDSLYLFGGHDGTRHLNDVYVFDFREALWCSLIVNGEPPVPRDSHVSVIHNDSMYVFGGSTGAAMNDFHELNLKKCCWRQIFPEKANRRASDADGQMSLRDGAPKQRFCHAAAVYGGSMYVFGGYDGQNRLNDLVKYKFPTPPKDGIPKSTLTQDLRNLVNNETLSDITFIVEGEPVHAHRVLCMRCTFFRAMLLGEMLEARQREVHIDQVKRSTFLHLMQYLYTDTVDVALDELMDLLEAADRFGVDR